MEPKKLRYEELPGLSKRQLSEHHDILYVGYVNKINALADLQKKADKTTANATYSDLREIKTEETFALNGVKLHEAYFDSMGGNGKPSGKILELINKNFGSFENWAEEFKALGLCARGWVVLAYDSETGILRNIICDAHNQGGIWNCIPLIVLDVYEHAYFIDYDTKRKDYIEAFMRTLSFEVANGKLKII